MNDKKNTRAEEEVRRTLDLLDNYPRQEASPWLTDRVKARLSRQEEPLQAASWNWALAVILLIVNATGLYFWTTPPLPSEDLAQTLGAEYGFSASDEDASAYLFPTTEDF